MTRVSLGNYIDIKIRKSKMDLNILSGTQHNPQDYKVITITIL